MTLRQARKLDPKRQAKAEQRKTRRRKARGMPTPPEKKNLVTTERRRVHTLQKAAARLRKSWRHGCPTFKENGKEYRKTWLDHAHDDYFAGNRLAIRAWRLKWSRQPGGFKSPPPKGDYNAEIYGKKRRPQ